MNFTIIAYLIYLGLTTTIVFIVGGILFKNGQVFLNEIFKKDINIAIAINKLLLTGYYLLNIGYAFTVIKFSKEINDLSTCIEMLAVKLGYIILVIGAVHFINIFFLFAFSSKKKETNLMES